MQILAISDSHGKVDSIRLLLKRYAGVIQTVVHLGDNAKDLLQFQSEYSDANLVAVAGNSDFYTTAPKEIVLTLGSRRILLMHGHSRNVKMGYERLMYYAQEKEVDACLFGHSHIPAVFSHGPIFFMNPGSISEPRGMSKAGYGILTINGGVITGEVHEL